jgi:hypothetical protein
MIDFKRARALVQEHLDGMYDDERESPKVLPGGFDAGDAWAPLIDWDGVMGDYILLVDKETGEITPQSFGEFEDREIQAV